MGTRIEIGDPAQHAGDASRILQAAWKPPCLHYSTDYLAWQFNFPGDLPPLGALAFLDDAIVGCIALTARRFACGQEHLPAYVLSFVAVDPSAARRGLASAMYASLLDALPFEIPVFAFAEPGSIGERLLLDSFERASFRHHALQPCRAVGYLLRPGTPTTSGASAEETTSFQDFASAGRIPNMQRVVWTELTEEHWQHYRRDPRHRVMVIIRNAQGETVGTAMLVTAEIVSAQGLQQVPMLDSVALAEPTPDAVSAVFGFAARQSPAGSTVIASNLSHIDSVIVKTAGARALPSSFNAHAFLRGRTSVIETADALNLEVT